MAQPLTLQSIRHKLRSVSPKPVDKNDMPETSAYQTTRVTALKDGLNLNRRDGGLVKYDDISLLLVFQLDSDPDTWYIEVFVYGQAAPFRLSQKVINYRQFLPEISQRSKDNFFTFLVYLIDQTDSVYLDANTLDFLKSKKIISYPDFKLFEEYTRQLWFQLISLMKFHCEKCGEVYWVDEAKVNPQGAKTKCVKCQHIITVQKRTKSIPLKSKEERKTIPCPHCHYENPEGTQFCVMCQKPVDKLAAKPRSPIQLSSEMTREERPESVKGADSTLDLSGVPLQARAPTSPNLSLREIAMSLQDDLRTLENKFAWFTQFSRIMQLLGFIFLVSGFLLGVYIYFVLPDPEPPEVLTSTQRMTYAGVSLGAGFLLSLACIIVSNIIALTLEIERNTKVMALLLQRFISKEK